MTLIREMLNKVEEEHQGKLRQLDSIKVQQDSFLQNQAPLPSNSTNLQSSSNIFDAFQNESSSTTSEVNKDLSFLSLDEKERLANEKEQLKRMTNEAPLQPKVMNERSGTKQEAPKDLTSSLINSNLNMLNSSTSSNRYSAFQSSPIMSTSHSQPNFGAFQQSQTQNATPNYSALDNIMMPGGFNKAPVQSMNAMKNNQQQFQSSNFSAFNSQPMMKPNYNINTNSNSSTTPSKALSKSELDEFLN